MAASLKELLLEVLDLLVGGPLEERELRRRVRARLGSAAGAKLGVALEALAAEGLIEPSGTERRISEAGLESLARRGRYGGDTVAVLFTDIVASTELIDRLGEEQAHAVRLRLLKLMREAVLAHGGHEVKSLGDGLMAVFGEPAAAAASARAIQRAALADPSGQELRIGVDCGAAQREGADWFGLPVVIASRLCAAAAAGEILVSARVLERTGDADHEPPHDLALKGLADPVAAASLRWRAEAAGEGPRRRAPIARRRGAHGRQA